MARRSRNQNPALEVPGQPGAGMRARGFQFIAGADEVGRGSLFGAVVRER